MARPRRFLVRMILFLIAVIGVGTLLFVPLHGAFMANPALNGLIVGVFLLRRLQAKTLLGGHGIVF